MFSHKLYCRQNVCYRATIVNTQRSGRYIYLYIYLHMVKTSKERVNFFIFLTVSFLPEAVISKTTPHLKHHFWNIAHISGTRNLLSDNTTFRLHTNSFMDTNVLCFYLSFYMKTTFLSIWKLPGPVEITEGKQELKVKKVTFTCMYGSWWNFLIHPGETMTWQREGTCRMQETNLHTYLISMRKKGRKLLLAWELPGLLALENMQGGRN